MALPDAIRKTWPIPPGPSPCNRAFLACLRDRADHALLFKGAAIDKVCRRGMSSSVARCRSHVFSFVVQIEIPFITILRGIQQLRSTHRCLRCY